MGPLGGEVVLLPVVGDGRESGAKKLPSGCLGGGGGDGEAGRGASVPEGNGDGVIRFGSVLEAAGLIVGKGGGEDGIKDGGGDDVPFSLLGDARGGWLVVPLGSAGAGVGFGAPLMIGENVEPDEDVEDEGF
jgi:hypothetical protein